MTHSGEDSRLSILRECWKIQVAGVESPAIRACPGCWILIEHNEGCNQMTCRCGQKFCFLCLKTANSNGAYQCVPVDSKCPVAPVQTQLPST
ncbi:hypothetical protein DPMN_000944 [Dreissena polymorpha]|uniref:RBR-type E3 ubiquitin transferase n=1 Tax=Dreissena polymorpha TaxID=45954 RepID=A0A9D4MGC3_DREPO|nr:hypothetical protein DPMN_000943 [Dreissena polymorpha]KAH3877088.1 hypothetical protein DPMN_000944 [Dreissena polymorpha]